MILNIILLILLLIVLLVLITFIFIIFNPIVSEKFQQFTNLLINFNIGQDTSDRDKKNSNSEKKAFIVNDKDDKFLSSPVEKNRHYTCSMIKSTYKSGYNQISSCIGYGDCVKACPQHAIIMKDNVAVVTNLCCSCGECENICPQNLIRMAAPGSKISELINTQENEKTSETHSQKFNETVKWENNKSFKIWNYLYKFLNVAD